MYTEWEIRRALRESFAAEPQSPNPYCGQGQPALAWLVGNLQQMNSLVNRSRQMVASCWAHAHLN